MQADGHEVTVWQLEPAGHSQCADIPCQDRPVQATGVDLTEGWNIHVCIEEARWYRAPLTVEIMINQCDTAGTEQGLGCRAPHPKPL